MKLTITREALLVALRLASRAASKKNILPIAESVLLETTKNTLFITATDFSIWLRTTAEAKVSKTGSVAVPAKDFVGLVQKLSGDDVAMEFADGRMVLTCGKSKYQLPTLPGSDFPPFPSMEEPIAKARVGDLSAGVGMVAHAAAVEGAKSSSGQPTILFATHLLGLGNGERVRFCATDGYRMARFYGELKTDTAFEAAIPTLDLQRALGMFGSDDEVDIGTTLVNDKATQFWVRGAKTTAVCRLLEGKYPDVDRIVPAAYERRVTVQVKNLVNALERLMVVAADRSWLVSVTLPPGGDSLAIAGRSDDHGEGLEAVECTIESEDELRVSFNGRFLSEAVRSVTTDTAVLNLNGSINPMTVTEPGGEDYVCLLMPIRPEMNEAPKEEAA